MEIPTYPNETVQRELQEAKSWREKQIAKVCGDKSFVVCIRPKGELPWLYLENVADVVDYLVEGEPGDEWEMKWILMTRAEIEAMPEFEGW